MSKSAGGDLFASAAAVMQIISFIRVSSKYSLKKEADASDKLALFNPFFSMAGGTFAAFQGIAITSLSPAIENYSSAAGKIKLAARLGRITGALTPFAYVFSTIAVGTGIYGEKGSAARRTEALRSGDGAKLAGASMTLAGDSGQLIVNGWEPWSEPMLYQLNLLSALDAPLKLGFEIFQNETNAQHGMGIALRYPPVAGEEIFLEKRFESVTFNAQSGKFSFSPVSVLRTRASDAPWLVINSEALSSPNLTG
ncbi:hypothetical protein [Pseudomonas sp. TSRC2-2]|uniref:hypothetical protein n=1 Tax=unclassified Pseudomonas TaxID=196821 RepID=UPI003CF2853C